MKAIYKVFCFLPVVCVALPGIAAAGGNGAPVVEGGSESILKRLERIENKLDNQSLFDLYNQVQSLQAEVKKLRGELDTQRHMLEEMTQRQKDLYADMDSRVQKLEEQEQTADSDDIAIEMDPETATIDESGQQAAAEDAGTQETDVAATEDTGADAPAASATADSADARKAYDAAFNNLKNSDYVAATQAFQQYLTDYPGSDLADNARYWLGEAYYVTRDFEKAIAAYQQLLSDFPDSQKAPHAMLKIGYSHQELGNNDQAIQILNKLRNEYPDSTAASLASERIQQMQSAGT